MSDIMVFVKWYNGWFIIVFFLLKSFHLKCSCVFSSLYMHIDLRNCTNLHWYSVWSHEKFREEVWIHKKIFEYKNNTARQFYCKLFLIATDEKYRKILIQEIYLPKISPGIPWNRASIKNRRAELVLWSATKLDKSANENGHIINTTRPIIR